MPGPGHSAVVHSDYSKVGSDVLVGVGRKPSRHADSIARTFEKKFLEVEAIYTCEKLFGGWKLTDCNINMGTFFVQFVLVSFGLTLGFRLFSLLTMLSHDRFSFARLNVFLF